MRFGETEEFKEKYKPRYMIEAKNSELKNIYGYDKGTLLWHPQYGNTGVP